VGVQEQDTEGNVSTLEGESKGKQEKTVQEYLYIFFYSSPNYENEEIN
jgi:hypothetical protein